MHYLGIYLFGDDGLRTRIEVFDTDRVAEALARFDELTAERPAPRIENAATRSVERFDAAWKARDWERLTSLFAPGYRESDRRPIALLEIERERYLESLRPVFDTAVSGHSHELLATRGNRLALCRTLWRGAGPSEVEWLGLVEVDERGQRVAGVMWSPNDLDAAYAELDARFAAGEAAGHARVSPTMRSFLSAFAARDWNALAALFAPDVVVNDHRLLGWERLAGRGAYVEALKSLIDLAPDARLRLDHVRMSQHGLLWVAAWEGARDGGPFEVSWIIVSEHDASGTVGRFDQYDLDQIDTALARFAELRPDPLRIPANAAIRNAERWKVAYEAEDWEALRANCSPALVFDDRRGAILLTGDLDTFVANNRWLGKRGRTRIETFLLATAGERLALHRMRFHGE
ncbi:MAG: nuclear transport factor 2 family protein [Candidatus Binatia bacterium]